MNEIKKEGLERVLKRHEDNVSNIQAIVSRMIETGFTISTKELHDLSCVCVLLTKQAEEMAKKDASRIKIAFKREEDYKETFDRLEACITEKANELRKVLLYHTANPLDADAYEIVDNCVVLSQTWADKKAQEFVIPPTITRLRVKERIDNVKEAISELNAFVADNPNFGKGITTSHDSRRCLCWLDDDGGFHEEQEAYEFI
jgi:effector-binding domain-containing protein